MIPASALAPVASLGLVLAGCPDCPAVLGLDGAPGLPAALAAHRTACPATADVCPGCGCEAELHPHGDGWRCGDCLGELLSDAFSGPPAPARPRVRVLQARHPRGEHHDAAIAEPGQEAVA